MPSRRLEVLTGLLYFLTHVTSVAAVFLYGGSTTDPTAPLAGRTSVLLGAALEILLALGVTGTGITVFALLRRRSSVVGAGYLALRTLEASVILVGVVVLLPIVALPATTAAPALSSEISTALKAVHDWTFLVGPGLVVPFHTALLAGWLWRTRLAPRWIAALGVVGGPLVGLANLAVMFGLPQGAAAEIPVFAWEISWAVWLIATGLRIRAAQPA
ncbi:DUF4386 domain-containing protein [Aestuariimicrobium sp. T2.26MG-19.2B]|uniref:DUF4386 domain-containing protein n=1 Tax=Aestuariimicrobium sp. T2.26MG-19.2B TaxID=3040679 RepID=UPI002477831B|nr:DUF4386 domain-containing protein [Aestuariimicrobium sp. T2.26MG-19.2B]CAI9405103.1 hypothetical protein AESSP_01344 [Aestuariimicrobium sp. T2.26MG-19.2B]